MVRGIKILGVLWLFLWLVQNPLFSEKLTVLYDDYPPFEYEENGIAMGISVDVIKAAFSEANLEADFVLYPFSRAYQMVTEGDEPVFYCSLIRTEDRESLVQWVGIVAPAEQNLLALRHKNIQITALTDLKNYRIGTVLDDVIDQFLRKHQESIGFSIDDVFTYEMNMKKFLAERFEIWAGNKYVGAFLANRLGFSAERIEVVYEFKDMPIDLYLVASKTVLPEYVSQLRDALKTIHASGMYQKIVDSY